jgi:hypothetical protein
VAGSTYYFLWQTLVILLGIIISCASLYFAGDGFIVIIEFKNNGIFGMVF